MNELTGYFNSITMPEPCAERIAQKLNPSGSEKKEGYVVMKRPISGSRPGWLAGVLACVVLAAAGLLALQGISGNAAAGLPTSPETTSTEAIKQDISQLQQERELYKEEQEAMRPREITEGNAVVCENLEYRDGRVYLIYEDQEYDITEGIPEALLTEEEAAAKADFEDGLRYTEGNITYFYDPSGESGTFYDTNLHTPFTEVVDDRVYFIANGEYLDITDQFSEEEPFTYIFTDSKLLTHYIAIGGTAANPGFLEMIHMTWEDGFTASCGGIGINTWNSGADARYGWETRAKEIFEPYGVYWAS